jgi:hypothetical protein
VTLIKNTTRNELVQDMLSAMTALVDIGSSKYVYRSAEPDPTVPANWHLQFSIMDNKGAFVEGYRLADIAHILSTNPISTDILQQQRVDYYESPKAYLHPTSALALFLITFDALGILTNAVIASCLFYYRALRPIKNILPSMSIAMIAGVVLVQFSVLFYVGVPSQATCTVRKLLADVGFAMFFG